MLLKSIRRMFFGPPTETKLPPPTPQLPCGSDGKKSRFEASFEGAVRRNYRLINEIGKGSTARVFQVMEFDNSRLYAVKVVRKADIENDPFAQCCIRREIILSHQLRHRNLVRFHYSHEDAEFLFIAMEFCLRGDLARMLKLSSVGLDVRRAVIIMREVFQALQYMHKRGVSHRDIKLENILRAQDGSVRLADLGSVHWNRGDEDTLSTRVYGSTQYAAPEVLRGTGYVPRFTDLWSCGITLFALLTNSMPFDAEWWHSVKGDVKSGHVARALQHKGLYGLSLACQALLQGLLTVDPLERISVAKAIRLCDGAVRLEDLAEREMRTRRR